MIGNRDQRNLFFERLVSVRAHWLKRSACYQQDLLRLFRFFIPQGSRVLEVGCGLGHLLKGLEPTGGLGVDACAGMIKEANQTFPELRWKQADIECDAIKEKPFDYIVMSNLLGLLGDVQSTLGNVYDIADDQTRIIVSYYSRFWQPVLKIAERIGLKMPEPVQNWLSLEDIINLFELSGYEVLRTGRRMLLPVNIPLVSWMVNTLIAKLPLVNRFCLTTYLVARKRPACRRDCSVSVIIPTKDEAGNILNAVERLPMLGTHTEIIFVDGDSKDGTLGQIKKAMDSYPEKDIKFFTQSGAGKGNAVFEGFDRANGDLLMILDSDLAVAPEELVKFYEPFAEGRAEFLNGCRLIYPMQDAAMRYLNLMANHFFALAFSMILGFRIKDTLCGTKVISREAYERLNANRYFFGNLDPFGDFDLILGAVRLNLKMLDVPVHYRARKYGEIKISRFSDGLFLLRMLKKAYTRFQVR
ncbi:glycosyltransferase [Pontiellaceae bacterium B12219]|nr:glycosyltransferase [Pontiellaceae bacterium B12219]